jgi:hypothetical protein
MSALESGRARSLHQATQAVVAELKALPLDPETSRANYHRLFDAARLCRRLADATSAMTSADAAMWQQRSQWLQEE